MSTNIIITSGKGGVGKSTAAVFLAKELAGMGKNTLLIDSDTALGADEIIAGVGESAAFNWDDILCERCEKAQGLTEVCDNLSLIACPKYIPEEVPDDAFSRLAETYGEDFDYILIDCPAGVDNDFRKAAAAAEKALIVATADGISIACASETAEQLIGLGYKETDLRLLVNRFVKKAAKRSRLLNIDGAIDKSGVRLIGILPEDKRIPFMSVTGKGPDKSGRFMLAISRVTKRIAGESVPLALNKL